LEHGHAQSVGAPIRAATFDCYGTLVDWEGGAAAFLYDLARRCGDTDPEPGKVLRKQWEALQFERLKPYRPYREVLSDSLSEWAGQHGHRWNERHGHELCDSMRSWQPFPDTIPALTKAKAAGIKLAIVSNTDRAIMSHTLRQLDGLEFDEVVVAEDVKEYKPGHAPFRRALDLLRLPASQVLHVAFGFKYDIGPAQQLGMQTAWVNRHAEPAPGDERPDHEWRDLWGLADLTERQAAAPSG
jgi:2-haloalkanoic acid dehalogenase type II